LTHNPIKTNKNKTKTKTIKQEIPEETMDEIKATLEKYLENLNNSVYDNPDNIQYDPKKKRIIKLECNVNKSDLTMEFIKKNEDKMNFKILSRNNFNYKKKK
jgi:hypothetical protein